MTMKIMGKKVGMTHLFDEDGNLVVCTVISVEPNVVTQLKTKETDGYNAVQLGYGKLTCKDERTLEKRVKKPQLCFFKKNKIEPRKHLSESRVENIEEYQVGQEIGVGFFNEVKFVDATAITKGKGFQGAVKRYNFGGGRASHGSGFHRGLGSTGGCSDPGRVWKGKKMPGHMGNKKQTTQSLKVVMVNEEDQLIVVKGAVPGPRNGLVYVSPAEKKGNK